jgi:hypothetical protein
MRRLLATVFSVAILLAAVPTAPAGAIQGGNVDWSTHPYVSALTGSTGRPYCSGNLVANRMPGKVFLTSAHCLGQGVTGNRSGARLGPRCPVARPSSGPIT